MLALPVLLSLAIATRLWIFWSRRHRFAVLCERETLLRSGKLALVVAQYHGHYAKKREVTRYNRLVDLMTRFSVHIKRLWFTHWHLTLTSFFRQQSNDDWFALHESEPEDRKRLRSYFVFWKLYSLEKYNRPIVPSEPGKNCERGI